MNSTKYEVSDQGWPLTSQVEPTRHEDQVEDKVSWNFTPWTYVPSLDEL